MNTNTEEQLARWVAEKVEDEIGPVAFGGHHPQHVVYIYNLHPLSFTQYLSCKNVAGRLLDWADDRRNWPADTPRKHTKAIETLKLFMVEAWDDTPAAILALAEACGFAAHPQPTTPVDSQIPGDVDDNQEKE